MHSFSCSPRCGAHGSTARASRMSAAPSRSVAVRSCCHQLRAAAAVLAAPSAAAAAAGIGLRRQSSPARPAFRAASPAAPNASNDTVRLKNTLLIKIKRKQSRFRFANGEAFVFFIFLVLLTSPPPLSPLPPSRAALPSPDPLRRDRPRHLPQRHRRRPRRQTAAHPPPAGERRAALREQQRGRLGGLEGRGAAPLRGILW